MKIRIYYNLYADPVPARDGELKLCLRKNRECKLVDEVVLLGGRPTFAQYFAEITKDAGPEDISIILNSDVYVTDESVELLKGIKPEEAYALTRWDVQPEGDPLFYGHKDSQDVWCIRGKPKVMVANFPLGWPGCDNRIAAILMGAGYKVSNPSLSIKTYHVHLSAVRRQGENPWHIVGKPYLLISPHMLGINPVLEIRR